ncbi:MAG TPA: ATP-binding protein [Vicinamibacterales bacterium]|nr:ATP-binding protein [Vicinamibacterales bacterium]
MFETRPTPEPQRPAPEGRHKVLDNPRVLTAAFLLLVGLIAGLFWLSRRAAETDTQVLTDVLLYPLLALSIALLFTLGLVLTRNLLKLWWDHRQAAPFAKYRAKLVGALLAMSIIPAVLVLISGSEIISNSAARWFSEPVDEVLTSAQKIVSRFYQDQQADVTRHAQQLARAVPVAAVSSSDEAALAGPLKAELATMRDSLIELYRRKPGPTVDVVFVTAAESTALQLGPLRASADRLALRAVDTRSDQTSQDLLDSGGVLLRTATPIANADGQIVGALVVSKHLDAEIERESRRAIAAYERYKGLFVRQDPILASYLTIFLTVTLLILIAATWLGLYLAKRITRPVQLLAEGARAIGAGHLDVRLQAETGDELGSLVEAFNMMAAELETNRGKLERSSHDLERKNVEVEGRRRYIETILERVATGVISLDAAGRIQTINGAAQRLLGLETSTVGHPIRAVFAREDLAPLAPLVSAVEERTERGLVQEVALTRDGREINLATAATVLAGADGGAEGAVLVLDDVTPLIRAQRVAAWRDVARRLAHEIKNPLTPIQLSAERLRRHFTNSSVPAQSTALVGECTDAIITEVEALKGLVDEFAQFARLRGPRMVPADLNRVVDDTLGLYAGVLRQGHLRIERQLGAEVPPVRIDAEQIRQVIINLVDNAMEALGGPAAPARPGGEPPLIIVMTLHDKRNGLVRLLVSDNGPGVSAADRDKLFMPYYSTKGRGSGLGLAIVRRIIVEHGGGIEVGDAHPAGTTFTVELPAA